VSAVHFCDLTNTTGMSHLKATILTLTNRATF